MTKKAGHAAHSYSWLVLLFLLGSCATHDRTTTPAVAQPPTTVIPVPIATVALAPPSAGANIPTYAYEVVNSYPHDPGAFVQGLVFHDGVLYEGTGLHGRSTVRIVELETGRVLQRYDLAPQYFGEGITIFEDRLVQLTWKSRTGLVYTSDRLQQVAEFQYPTEGWGITHDGEHLIMSDGTSTLYLLKPDTFEQSGQIDVVDQYGPVARLNELEYIDGEIYANIWQTNRIARINPHTGRVTAWIDLAGLLQAEHVTQPVDVLNGIAHDPGTDRLFVTGKLWPRVFEIKLIASR